jgi:hypothetical protein
MGDDQFLKTGCDIGGGDVANNNNQQTTNQQQTNKQPTTNKNQQQQRTNNNKFKLTHYLASQAPVPACKAIRLTTLQSLH